MIDVGFFPHIADPIERKRRVDEAFSSNEREQLLETLRRTTAADRIYMAGEIAMAFPEQLEAQRIREGRYGDRIPAALFDDPSPVIQDALRRAGHLPPDLKPAT